MLINLRNALMAGKRLPYDAEVEYLESTGTQWIDTGVLGGDGTHAKITVKKIGNYTNECILGAWANSTNRLWLCYTNGNKWFPGYGSVAGATSVSSNTKEWFRIESIVEGGYFGYKIDGVNYLNSRKYTAGFSCVNSILMFAMGTDNGANYLAHSQVSACQIVQNGVLVRDFIPVRKGTTGYLYDRVSGKLFGNAGTGDFVLGPDVVPVEYIESSGTQYIDTGVVPGPGLDYSISFAFTSISSYSYILGAWSSDGSNYYDLAEQNNTLLYAGFGTISQAVEKLPVGVFSTVEKRGLDIYVVGGRKRTYPADIQSGSISSTILLFGVHRNYGPGYIAATQPLRVKSFSLVGNDTPVRNLLPVRVGQEGAMMDVLTRRIYRNAGTGAFGYGNDLKYPIPA